MKTHTEVFSKKLQLKVEPAFERSGDAGPCAAGLTLSPQKVEPSPSLTFVDLTAEVKGFQEQKTDLSCNFYS